MCCMFIDIIYHNLVINFTIIIYNLIISMLPSRYLISKKKINYKNNNIKSLEHPHRIQLKRIKWKLSWSSCYLKAAQS